MGKIITAAGVSAGIDMGLTLLAELKGAQVAKAVQLAIEYDPRPPFDAEHMSLADSATIAMASAGLAARGKVPRAWE